MSSPERRSEAFRFGVFELDPATGELRKQGVRIKLQEQPRQLLLILLEQAGQVVTREQIQKRMWADDTFVDFDNAINTAVRKLRDALGDKADNPRFVETLARRGYRFVAPVSRATDAAPVSRATDAAPVSGATAAPSHLDSIPPVPLAPVSIPQPSPWRRWAMLAGMLVAFAAAVLVWLDSRNTRPEDGELPLSALTGNRGMELHPSFSPDGTRVAYSWGEQDGRTFSVYVKLIGAGDPVVLAKDVGENPSPAWSPDGRWIAVLKDLGCQASLLLIPASGGQSSELTRLNKAPPNIKNCVPPAALYPGSWLTWSADSKYLFTSAKNKAEATFQIVRISVASGQQQPITFPGPELASGGLGSGDTGPAVSPDGRSLAFVRASGLWNSDIYVATLPTSNGMAGEPRRVTSHNADLRTPAWTEDGEDLIFSSNRGGRRRLWRVSASGSAEAVPVVGLGENATDVTIPPGGGHLVYGRANAQGSLWRFPIDGTKAGKPERIAETAARITHPHHSPDSARIVFQSGRSSVYEIWKCDSKGANMVQLTNFGKGAAGSPRWSPDGETIAFDANVDGHWEIYAIRSEGGRPVRLTTGKGNVVPNWSADGSWIYYTATEGTSNVWKVRPDGSTITQVTKDGGMFATESPDGRYLYYMKMVSNTGEIWRTPVDSPSPSKVLSDARGRLFTVTARGIYFMAGSDIPELRFFDLESQSTRVVNTSIGSPFVAVTTDGKWAVYSRNENSGSNLMVVENFK